jgi:signal transduction histidine kinase/CheY-like chemotaxis protein
MLPSDRIMSLFLDDENELWIGTQGKGLSIYNDKESKFNAKIESLLSAKTIWDIFKDSKGRKWLGTQNEGLIQFDKQKGEIKKYPFSKNIRVITEDNQGNLWIGTDANGLFKLNIEKEDFKAYTYKNEENSISGNSIKSLYYNDNVLWVGTNGDGLSVFDIKNEKFHHFTEKEGLANDVVYGILPDKDNNLWLSSNKGITKFSIDRDSFKSPQIVNYDNYAGLATEFNTGAYFKNTNGDLYFGGLEGFYWFNPNAIKENLILPKTTITKFDVLNESRPLLANTELKHNQNTLTFTFSSLQFALPEKNLYQYKLLNYDEEWVNVENNNSVRYTRLPPGNYTFQVKSSNYDGVWNETPATFGFTIKAPWFFNFYSKLAYVVLILSVLYGIYWYLKSRWRMRLDLRLQEEEAQRFKKLNDYKSKLYTDIAHEFRTPLTLISGPIDSKLTEGKLSDYDYANFSTIKRNANRLTALVDQLLQLAKLEKGKLKLTIAKGNLGLFLHTIAQSFSYSASAKEIDYTYSIDKIEDVWYDEDAIEKIISNLISNAIKYTPQQGFCNFKVANKEGTLFLEIKNSVENSADIQLDKLFDRFYQKDEFSQGAGVGLSLVKELVKLYKGTINVISQDNSILFNVLLPLDKNVFSNNEVLFKTEGSIFNNELIENIDLSDETLQNKNEESPILLIVEDNTEVRAFIKMSLQHKYQIIEAENGQEGIDKAIEYVPDIILSDIRMPLKDGIALCNTLKYDERTSHIPILLLTADATEENELKGLESGADDFITKPFKLRILEKRLENLIGLRKALRNRYSQEFILKPTDISITSTDEAFLTKLQEIIDADFSNPDFNAVVFCKKIGMSRMQLHRKLLAYTGLSTSAFIRSQRLKQALDILKTSDATVNEVAYTVGFNTPSYFIKCFKEAYKKTPLEYLQLIDK